MLSTNILRMSTLTFVCGAALCAGSIATAQTEPIGGQPPPGAKQSVADLEAQVAYQRAFEAILWAMPASAVYRLRVGLLELPGMADNVITAYSGPLRTNAELITANQVTPYIAGVSDLRNGPVVLEVPAKTAKAVLYGQVVDAWQATIAEVGPVGADKGAGGKYLFLPPGYQGSIPDGYFVVRSESLLNPFRVPLDSIGGGDRSRRLRLQQDAKNVCAIRGSQSKAYTLCRWATLPPPYPAVLRPASTAGHL